MSVEEMNKMQRVKRTFFALRNGEMGRQLREMGAPYQIIFGLNVPQLAGVAAQFGHDIELARELWANRSTRESLLLAPMLVDPAQFAEEEAARWLRDAPTPEVADILSHRLLRHLQYAPAMAVRLSGEPEAMTRYGALRLVANLLNSKRFDFGEAERMARRELKSGEPLTASVCRLIIDQVDFLRDGC